ncbi:hypothetical protein [Solemya elarraichensis gill symbiont]|uniref:Glycosyltransferase n=1 Tax=Solemya elarraichensis gill symbiont TaxID=1918949 RepID=A0A1T2LCQ8_9GAMM|nr:hypothetical protein [Solemya elarraichensis gill symbiont]OOZ42726.1 hypothetical protein BOW52_01830 [Solemya elarraichensis gill symbiont]
MNSQTESPVQTVICLKWGTRYGSDYVNRLYGMVKRNTERPLRLVCFTDDSDGIQEGIEIKPMPPFDLPEKMRSHPFRRMFIFAEQLNDLQGTVLHLDLDLVVTGSIDKLFNFNPDSRFITIENWTQKGQGIGNMSVFRYRIGELTEVWERFRPDPMAMMNLYHNSQTFVCRTLGDVDFYPANWCLSFKHSLVPKWPLNFLVSPKLPEETKIIAFTGQPDINEAIRGEWPVSSNWKKLYKHVRPSPWLADHWR